MFTLITQLVYMAFMKACIWLVICPKWAGNSNIHSFVFPDGFGRIQASASQSSMTAIIRQQQQQQSGYSTFLSENHPTHQQQQLTLNPCALSGVPVSAHTADLSANSCAGHPGHFRCSVDNLVDQQHQDNQAQFMVSASNSFKMIVSEHLIFSESEGQMVCRHYLILCSAFYFGFLCLLVLSYSFMGPK